MGTLKTYKQISEKEKESDVKNIIEKSKQTHSAIMKAIIDKNQREKEPEKDLNLSKENQKNQEVAFDLMQ